DIVSTRFQLANQLDSQLSRCSEHCRALAHRMTKITQHPVPWRCRMFSSRFHWDFQPNRLSMAIAERRAAGQRLLDLTESNPTHAGLNYPADTVTALADPRLLAYEPAPAGSGEAREAVVRYYAGRGTDVPGSRVLLTASTSEAYCYLFKLLTN